MRSASCFPCAPSLLNWVPFPTRDRFAPNDGLESGASFGPNRYGNHSVDMMKATRHDVFLQGCPVSVCALLDIPDMTAFARLST